LENLTDIAEVSHVIQLAVAPVFLLTGIGAVLSVLINRLGRVTDRFRTLEHLPDNLPDIARASVRDEMNRLMRRACLVHWAIGTCTGSALLICIVIALMFAGSVTGVKTPILIAVLFIIAMLALVSGLLLFLREIAIAQSSIHTVPR
jgi:hypothetical protein